MDELKVGEVRMVMRARHYGFIVVGDNPNVHFRTDHGRKFVATPSGIEWSPERPSRPPYPGDQVRVLVKTGNGNARAPRWGLDDDYQFAADVLAPLRQMDLVNQVAGKVAGSRDVALKLLEHHGTTPLRQLIAAGVTERDFWQFFCQYCDRRLDRLKQLSREGVLTARLIEWRNQYQPMSH